MALDSEEGKKELLDRLGKESFTRLAAELGVSENDLIEYLLSLSEDVEPDDQPWWPEALARLVRGVPIRDVAWIFRQASGAIRRAIEREGLDTARVGADEIAIVRAPVIVETPAGAEPAATEAMDQGIEPLPGPAWATWEPIDSLVERELERASEGTGASDAKSLERPRDADTPLEDPAESFGWRAVPDVASMSEGAEDEDAPGRRAARSGSVRLVRPDDERTPQPAVTPVVPALRERKRNSGTRKGAASPVRMRSPDEVDLSELMSDLRRATSLVSPPSTRAPLPARATPRRRYAWEIQLGSGRTVVVAADDALSALARVADVATSAELVSATLRRVPFAG